MCLILLAYRYHPRWPLVVAANRDEYFARPTAPARFWPTKPQLLGGCDLRDGGTWLGVTRAGRFAAVTNFRDPRHQIPNAPSRGLLVRDYLCDPRAPAHLLETLQPRAADFNGFNLLAGDPQSLWYFSNRDGDPRRLAPGLYGLSNHLLDTAWPKVADGKQALQQWLDTEPPAVEPLFAVLGDRQPASDHLLPDTGISRDWERALSARFIQTPDYGTRSSTVVLLRADGALSFTERSFGPGGIVEGTREFHLRIGPEGVL